MKLVSHMLLASAVALPALFTTSVVAQESRGVNPADIDSRFDVITKRVRLDGGGNTDVLTFKYDYKLNQEWGLNFELPAYTKVAVPGFSASGTGDFFARARWIVPAGAWIYGASFEAVLPTATDDALGTGRGQLNFGALAVKPVSQSFIFALVAKQTTSVGGDSERAGFSNTEVRFIPVFILPAGWAITGEARHVWEHRTNTNWQRLEGTVNKQFDLHWAGSVSYSRDFGDKKDRGAISAAVKYFF
ncbi:MAG: hypothetical protein KBF66_03300 [Rhodoferax sp.]|uniref:hypothetical protein n=1 Tax=Rhodoferax sp. TaxID=50421 RepID=UPI001B7C114C|nr:hypothetical protein [Rhodoferax sp.]MBP9904557.1 hypothetical protein [Rhodoferax sp.]